MNSTKQSAPTVRPNIRVPLLERVRIALDYAVQGDAAAAADQLRHAIAEEAQRDAKVAA